MMLALSEAGAGGLSKEQCFARVWPGLRYSPERHDPTIWNLLYRLRKELGLEASIADGVARISRLRVLE